MGVLILLGVMVAIFAFTLGVHLGKRVNPKPVSVHTDAPDAETAQTLPDKVPDKHDITEQAKGVESAADESLGQALHEEVIKTGIKLDQPRQIELPKNSRSAKGPSEPPPSHVREAAPESSASHESHDETLAEAEHAADESATESAEPAASAGGQFAVQVGSYPSQREAQHYANTLKAKHLATSIQSAEVKGKGKWYRVFAGRFATRAEAESAGDTYKAKHLIDSFVIAKISK